MNTVTTHDTADGHDAASRARIAGSVLLGASVLECLAMLHHPSVAVTDVAEALQQIARFSGLAAGIHAVLMALLLAVAFGFWEFAAVRGLHRLLIRAGVLAYGAGVLMMLGAALVDGFGFAGIATLMPQQTPVELQIDHQLLTFCRILNQACANAAVVAMSIGIVAWSLDLVRDAGAARLVAAIGLVVGLAPGIALVTGVIHLNVDGMTHVVAIQAVWNAAVALLLLRHGTRRKALPCQGSCEADLNSLAIASPDR